MYYIYLYIYILKVRELFDCNLLFIPHGIKRCKILFAQIITCYYQYTHIVLYSHVSGKNIVTNHNFCIFLYITYTIRSLTRVYVNTGYIN